MFPLLKDLVRFIKLYVCKIQKARIQLKDFKDLVILNLISGGYPINLLESPLTKENNEVNIKILDEPDKKGVWMGVAILDIVKNNNFQSCYGIGKGTYAIDQVGATHMSAYSWNHHDSNYNSQPKVVISLIYLGMAI